MPGCGGVRGYRTEADLPAAYFVMQREEIVIPGCRGDMDEAAVRSYLTV